MKRRYHVSVDRIVELDPDRLEEYVRANYDTDRESVEIMDIEASDGLRTPIVIDAGPYLDDLVRDHGGLEDGDLE